MFYILISLFQCFNFSVFVLFCLMFCYILCPAIFFYRRLIKVASVRIHYNNHRKILYFQLSNRFRPQIIICDYF